MKERRSLPTSRPAPTAGPGEILLPRWAVLITVAVSWAAGLAMLGFELTGQARFAVMLLATWLITWPVVATNPMEALGDFLRGVFPGSGGEEPKQSEPGKR
jgi:hypothetical protein